MIASARGLAVLAAIAVALLVAVLLGGAPKAPVDRSIAPDLEPGGITALQFTRGTEAVRVTRAGATWYLPAGVAEPAAVDGVLTALRGGRWHRRADRAAAGTLRASITIVGAQPQTLSIGDELPGTGQTWIVRGDAALLVDTWVASALAPELSALRMRHPLGGCSSAATITATVRDQTLRIEGQRLVEPIPLWIDPRWTRALHEACTNLAFVDEPRRTTEPTPWLSFAADGAELRTAGTCAGDRTYVETSIGAGCVDLRPLDDALVALTRPATEVADPRPLPFSPVHITLADGTVLDLHGKPRLDAADADPERVRELIAALQSPGEMQVPPPTSKPTASITAADRGGRKLLLELHDRVVMRAGQSVAIRIAPDAWAILTRPSAHLRDPTRWREDPSTISSIAIDDVTYTRGAVLGEWTREPAGTADATLVEALAETLATVRAPLAPSPKAIRHRIRVTITPPAGAATTHTIELGAPTGGGCQGRIDEEPVLLPLPLCTAAIALAAQK